MDLPSDPRASAGPGICAGRSDPAASDLLWSNLVPSNLIGTDRILSEFELLTAAAALYCARRSLAELSKAMPPEAAIAADSQRSSRGSRMRSRPTTLT